MDSLVREEVESAMFHRKTALLLLLAIVLVALAVRYPLVEHERFQTDSYFIHYMSNSIVREGYAAWTFNALSYVGYYPFSYPSGVPFVLAELSLLTGMGVDVCILLTDGILATLFCLVVFCLSREFVHRVEFALLAAFLAVIAPRFVDTTYWVGSARGMEVVLITLLVFGTFRAGFSQSKRLLFVSGLVAFACFAVHHMAVLIILFGIGFVFADIAGRYFPRIFQNRVRRWAIVAATFLGVTVAIVALNYFGILGNSLEAIGETGFFHFDIPAINTLGNLIVSYTHQIGFVLVLAALGIVTFLKTPRFFMRGVYPLAVMLVFVPVLGSSLYVSMLLAPFVAILGVLWLQSLGSSKKAKSGTLTVVVVVLMVLSPTFTVWSADRWNQAQQFSGDRVEVANVVFNDATYLSSGWDGIYGMCNVGSLEAQLTAYANVNFLESGIQATVDKDVTSKDIKDNMTPSATPFPGNLYAWFVYKNDSLVSRYVLALMTAGVVVTKGSTGEFPDYAKSHTNLIVVIDNNWPSTYVDSYGDRTARFPDEVRDCKASTPPYDDISSYSTYASQRLTIYMVQLPG
jgi:hypothetical protein